MKLNFYPGPSKLDESIQEFMLLALNERILEYNHRSTQFHELYQKTENTFKEKLDIPDDYKLYFISSATEAWEIIAQSFTQKGSLHMHNGAFGEKWRNCAHKLIGTESLEFGLNELPQSEVLLTMIDIICLTHNETSNGSVIPTPFFKKLKTPEQALIAVDATSSLGGVELPWNHIDICFASVQKCFGLPSGMGVMICSPEAVSKGLSIDEDDYYNSFTKLERNRLKWETSFTPNILDIYLLQSVLNNRKPIGEIATETKGKAALLYNFLDSHHSLAPLITEHELQSETVVAVRANEKTLTDIIEKTYQEEILLGKGYGKWENDTFRIANFPAISKEEIIQLILFLNEI